MPLSRKNGATSVSEFFVLRDSTTHAPKTGVTISNITLLVDYSNVNQAQTSLGALTALPGGVTDAWNTLHGIEKGNGVYRVDVPDAVYAAGIGAKSVLTITATGCDNTYLEIELSPPVDVEAWYSSAVTGALGSLADLVAALMVPQKNVVLANFPLPMTLTGTTTQATAGLLLTVLINKDKAGWGACAGTKYVTDAQGVGWVDWVAADLNANTVGVIVTATGCNPLMFSLLPK